MPVRQSKQKRFIWIIDTLLSGILITCLSLIFFSYKHTKQYLTDSIFKQAQTICNMAAIFIDERFDRLTDIGRSLASRAQFRKLIEQGKWKEAALILTSVPKDFTSIDRILLVDKTGTIMADLPELVEMHGQNFAYRDWYQSVSQKWEPIISEIYQRKATPVTNVIAFAIPIKAEDKTILGILVLQVRVDTLFEWSQKINVGQNGFMNFVDRKGHIVGNPQYLGHSISDHSSLPIVEKIRHGEQGIGIFNDGLNSENSLMAYTQLPKHHWGIFSQQPVADAFLERNKILRRDLQLFVILAILGFLFIYAIHKALVKKYQAIHALSLATKKIRNNEIFLDAIIENIPNMVFVKDAKTLKFIKFNKSGEEMLGFSQEDFMGKNDYDFFPKEEADFFTEKDRTVLNEKRGIDIPEEPIHTKNGEVKYVHTKKVPILSAEGDPLYLLGISEDITERKIMDTQLQRVNQELSEQTTQLESINQELESFSYSVSHDLRAPLRAIDGFSQAVLEDYQDKLDGKGRDYLERIRKAAQRMAALIDDLLDLSRVSRIEFQKSHVNMSALAIEIIKEIEQSKPERKVCWKIAPNLHATGDNNLLRIVLTNLLGNAWKFSLKNPNPTIEFASIKQQKGKKEFYVKDNGIGFDIKYAEKLFKPFQRLHSKDDFEGTGIGLVIVERIIRRHGGKIRVESRIDYGATFYFTLS